MKRITLTALIFCLALPFAADAKQKLYKWVDENGVTHYGSQPPVGQQAEQIKVSTGHSEASRYQPPAREETTETDQKPAALTPQQASSKDPERCEQVRKNIWNLENFPRVRVDDEDTGEKRFLSPEEHQQWLADARKQEKEFCE